MTHGVICCLSRTPTDTCPPDPSLGMTAFPEIFLLHASAGVYRVVISCFKASVA